MKMIKGCKRIHYTIQSINTVWKDHKRTAANDHVVWRAMVSSTCDRDLEEESAEYET